MKLFALFLFTFSATVYADVYKCRSVYSQSPCGANEEIIKFATQTKPITTERQISSETHPTSGAKIISVITGKVVRVADGDTITVLASTGKEKKSASPKLMRPKPHISAVQRNRMARKQEPIYGN